MYIDPDGSVVFADLAAELVPVALALDPDLAEPEKKSDQHEQEA